MTDSAIAQRISERIEEHLMSFFDFSEAHEDDWESLAVAVSGIVEDELASGMSAGTAETRSGSGLQPARPTAEGGDAQPLSTLRGK